MGPGEGPVARSAELDETLATLARVLGVLCALFQPVTPEKMGGARDAARTVRRPDARRRDSRVSRAVAAVTVGEPLFPRVVPARAASLRINPRRAAPLAPFRTKVLIGGLTAVFDCS